MADDIDLPVFPFRINWREPVNERLEWKTDVLAGTTGNEQRRAMRLSPRRTFEPTITLFNRERSFHDLWLTRMLNTEVMFPVWPEATPLTANAAMGATTLMLDTNGVDLPEGSLAVLLGATAFENEVVTIDTVASDHVVISAGIAKAWARGARFAPMRRGFYSAESGNINRATRTAWEGSARFEINRANDYSLGVDSSDVYLGIPVLAARPDENQDTDYSFAWNMEELDSDSGRRTRISSLGRALVGQKLTYLLRGRDDKVAFRQFLYRQQGMLNPIWLPTFNEDMRLARDAALGQNFIEIEQIGYGYTGGAVSGRNHIRIETKVGTSYHEITGTAPATFGGREKLLLNPVLPRLVSQDAVRCISFIDTARLAADAIELSHISGIDGATTAQPPFVTFRSERTAPTPIYLPIPSGTKSVGYCGPAAPDDPDLCNPFAVFDGWWLKVKIEYQSVNAEAPNFEFIMDGDLDGIPEGSNGIAPGYPWSPSPLYWSQVGAGEDVTGLEMTFWADHWPDDFTRTTRNWRLSMQFPAFSVIPNPSTAILTIQRWDEIGYSTVSPTGGTGAVPPQFDIQSLWPREYTFHF